MFKRKLLKRALPIILSVAMVFESMPATALAAENGEVEITEEVNLEETESDSGDADASDAETKETDVQEESSTTAAKEEPATSQETETPGTDTEESKTETNTEAVAETKNAAETAETEKAAEVEASDADVQAALDTKITIELKEGQNGVEDGVITGTYNGEEIFANFVTTNLSQNNNTIIQVKVDGEAKNTLKSNLTYKWTKADAEGNYTALAAGMSPKDAGSYRLELSLDAVTNVCNAATASIDFKIKQAELKIVYSAEAHIGDKIADFVADIQKNYTLIGKDKDNNDVKYDKDEFIKSFNVAIADAVTGAAITYDANTVFEQGKDYTFTINAELNDANYKLAKMDQEVVQFSDAIVANMEITLLDEKLTTGYPYTGANLAKPVAGTAYTVKLTYTDEDGEDVEIANPAITAVWTDADGVELNEEGSDEIAPVDAGSYRLKLTFDDPTGRYEETTEYIDVKINPVSVYVEPVLSATEFSSGLSVSDILKNVTDYNILAVEGGAAPTNLDKSTFWGVSYNDDGRTQPFEPVFELQVSELQLDKDDKPLKDAGGKVQYSEYKKVGENGKLSAEVVDGSLKYQYRVVFSGKKVVYGYTTDGVTVKDKVVDVNDHGTDGSDTNYKVDMSADTIAKSAKAITIKNTTIVINTDAYNADVKTKVYDTVPLYASRADYKKATANGEGTLTYTWYKGIKKVTFNDKGEENVTYTPDYNNPVAVKNHTDKDGNQYNDGPAPYEVGDYVLVVSYYDAATGERATKQVGPYLIEKQKVQAELTPTDKKLVSYTGVSIADFIGELEDSEEIGRAVKPVVNNVFAPVTLGEALAWTLDEDYTLEYAVEYLDKNTNEWVEVDPSLSFVENREYRLIAMVEIKTKSALNKYYQSWEEKTDKDGEEYHYYYPSNVLTIEVQKMGTAQVRIEIDSSKIASKVKPYDALPFAIPDDAVTVTSLKDGKVLTREEAALSYQWYDKSDKNKVVKEAVNGGKYDLGVSFLGNETYAPFAEVKITDFEITPLSIILQPEIKEPVLAGTAARYNDKLISGYTFADGTQILEAELPFFYVEFIDEDDEEKSHRLIEVTEGAIYESDGTTVNGSVLKGNKTYYALANNSVFYKELNDLLLEELNLDFSRNYEVKYIKTEFTTTRGNAVVSRNDDYKTSLKDTIDGMTHKITPKEGVAHYYANISPVFDEEDNPISGNYFIFDIQAPLEYLVNGSKWNNFVDLTSGKKAYTGFVYENSIETAGGYILSEYSDYNNALTVAVPITKEDVDGKVQKSFQIRWEDGYVETFTVDCTGVVLEDDLTKAVAPRSLAFNTPATKMVVGEKQQLDVKVVKANLSDVVCLKYETKNPDILSVSDTGAVVALAMGSATVEAIPCYVDDNGNKVPIEGAKHAAAKISVINVTAPKIKSITAYDKPAYDEVEDEDGNVEYVYAGVDRYAVVEYPSVSDGYRREIYVLEGKGLKDTDFNVDGIKNGNWKAAGFAIAPVYDTTVSSQKGHMTYVYLHGLKPGTDYTVYVRNVSGIRTLADGSTVTASAAGSVKSFATTLPQVKELNISFDSKYYNPQVGRYGEYLVPISEKTITATTTGWFEEIYTNDKANTKDLKEYALPLTKEETASYVQPKLNYYVGKASNNELDFLSSVFEVESLDSIGLENYIVWSAANDIAKIDKNGKITLTGVGMLFVKVEDPVTRVSTIDYIIVTGEAERMEIAKSAKLKVGQKIDLFDMVTYYDANKTKLTGYVDYMNVMASLGLGKPVVLSYGVTTDSNTDSFVIQKEAVDGRGGILKNDFPGEVTAIKPNATMTLGVWDEDAGIKQDQAAIITITSSAIDPVKNLKTTVITDKYATITFAYSLDDIDWEWSDTTETTSTNQVYFRVQVQDASKRIVSDQYYNIFDDEEYLDYVIDPKKNIVTLTTTLGLGRDKKALTRKSAYTVSVTACCLDQVSKAASKGFKTTDIPAEYPFEQGGNFPVYNKQYPKEYQDYEGGMGITIGGGVGLEDYPTLTSNNTYTLVAWPENPEAKSRLSDTLTWKSTNTKVASLKVNAGTYTATLKALRKGVTKIEVSSKVTKRMIARWTVFVNAVGEASYYFGDLEPDEDTGVWGDYLDGFEYGEEQILTIDNPVKANLTSGEGLRAKFVAPADGEYWFNTTGSGMFVYEPETKERTNLVRDYNGEMYQGETYYFFVPGHRGTNDIGYETVTLTANGRPYQTMTMSGITLKEGATVTFTAPEDNYYEVYDKNGKKAGTIGGLKKGEKGKVTLNAGTYTVKKREITGKLTASDITIAAGTTNWYEFDAPETDTEYIVTSSALSMEVYESLMDESKKTGEKNITVSFDKDQNKYYVALKNDGKEDIKTTITIKSAVEKTVLVSEASSLELAEARTPSWVQVKIADAGTYHVKVSASVDADAATPTVDVYKANSTNALGQDYVGSLSDTTETIERDYDFTKGQIVYFRLSSTVEKTKVSITVSRVAVPDAPAEKINAGESKTDAKINVDSYAFTAKAAGTYIFTAEPIKTKLEDGTEKETPVYIAVYEEDGTPMNASRAAVSANYYLAAGQKVYVRYYTLQPTTAATTTVRIQEDVAEIFTETKTFELKDGESKSIEFRAPADGRYVFKTERKTETGAEAITIYDTNGSYIAEENGRYYKQGKGFKAELSASGANETYIITVSPVVPASVTGGEITLKANETLWFKFTAPEDGMYKDSCTDTDLADKYDSLVSLSRSNFGEMTLNAGDTRYYRISNNSDAERKVTLKAEKVAVEAITAGEGGGKVNALSNGESIIYSFRAPQSGYYRIDTSASAAEGKTASVDSSYYSDAKMNTEIYPDGYMKVFYLKATDTVYVKVECTTDADKANVTAAVAAIAPTDVTPANDPVVKDVTKTEKGTDWYSISGEGAYTVEISGAAGCRAYYAEDGVTSFERLDSSTDFIVGAEDTYTIAVDSYADSSSYKMTVTKRSLQQVTVGAPVTVQVKSGENAYVSFALPEDGRYAVMFDGITDGIAVEMTEEDGVSFEKHTNTYYTFAGEINDKPIFTISAEAAAEEKTVSITVSAAAITPATVTDITAAGTATIDVNSVKVGFMSWYAFTAPESAEYTVKVSDAKVSWAWCTYFDEYLNENYGDFAQAQKVSMKKGETRYYALWYDEKPDANAVFSISKFGEHELTIAQGITVETKDVVSGENYRVSFTAPEDGIYSFLCTQEKTDGSKVFGWGNISFQSDTHDYDGDSGWRMIYSLKQGEEFVFDTTYYNTYANADLKSYTISAVKQEFLPIAAGEDGTEITLKAGEYRYARIIPAKNCSLEITVDAGDGISYTDASTYINSNELTIDSYLLKEGRNVLKTYANAGDAAYICFHAEQDGKVKVSYNEADAEEQILVLGENKIAEDGTGRFIVERNGVYSFQRVTAYGNKIDLSIMTLDYETYEDGTVYLAKGDNALIDVSSGNTILITEIIPTQLSMNADASSGIKFTDKYAYVEFEAAQAGLYLLSSDTRRDIRFYHVNEGRSGWSDIEYNDYQSSNYADYQNSVYGKKAALDKGTYIARIERNYEGEDSADYTVSYYGRVEYDFDTAAERPTAYFIVNKDEAVYVDFLWDGSEDGPMSFDIKADSPVKVEYLPTLTSEAVDVGQGTNISTMREPHNSSYFRITGIQDDTPVRFRYDYDYDVQLLRNYEETEIYLEEDAKYAEYAYFCEKTGSYYIDYEYQISKVEIYSAAGALLETIDKKESRAIKAFNLAYGEEYRVRFYLVDGTNYGYCTLYPLNAADSVNSVPYGRDIELIYDEYSYDYSQRALFTFTAPQDGKYEFAWTLIEEADIYAHFYNAEGEEVYVDTDWTESDEGQRYFATYEMSEGDTVQVVLRGWNYISSNRTYPFSINKVDTP